MQVNKTYCDHCKKELDPKYDYPNTDIEVGGLGIMSITVDLCEGCMIELENLMYKFVNKEVPKDW